MKDVALISTRPVRKEISPTYYEENNVTFLPFPLTEILPLKEYEEFDLILQNLSSYHHLIFISTNAVDFFVARMNFYHITLPSSLIISCIGPSTKKLLQENFNTPVFYPRESFDSEHLLKSDIFSDIKNQKILIIRGIGGRETLRKGLEKKGGLITYGECYTRKYLQIDLEEVRKSTYEFNRIFMLITSYESAKKFMQHNITDHLGWLKSIHVIVNHIRLKNELNIFSNITITEDLSNDSILRILQKN